MNSAPPSLDRVADYRVDLTRLLYMFYMDLEQQLARADIKANLILTANSILLVATVNIVATRLRGMEQTYEMLWLLLPLVPALLFSALATNFALSAAYPRMLQRGNDEAPGGLFQSVSVAAMQLQDYEDRVLNSDLDQVKREVLRGIHAKAGILQIKFARVRSGIQSTVAAFLGWIAFMAITVVRG
ncbi:MAG: Pycsar system effector family protein [Panacagrimonas sp.]